MKLKSTLLVAATLMFASAPAWADSVKFHPETSSDSFQCLDHSSKSNPDVQGLGGFNNQNKSHDDFLLGFKEGHLIHIFFGQNSGTQGDPDKGGSDPVGTPEPASVTLLLVGLLGVGSLAYRRHQSVVSAS